MSSEDDDTTIEELGRMVDTHGSSIADTLEENHGESEDFPEDDVKGDMRDLDRVLKALESKTASIRHDFEESDERFQQASRIHENVAELFLLVDQIRDRLDGFKAGDDAGFYQSDMLHYTTSLDDLSSVVCDQASVLPTSR